MDDSMTYKSSLSIIAMAELIIVRDLSRWTSADSGEVCVCVTGTGRIEVPTTLPLNNACRMLLLVLKAGGFVPVFCASAEDFMVVIVVVIYQFDEQGKCRLCVPYDFRICNECMIKLASETSMNKKCTGPMYGTRTVPGRLCGTIITMTVLKKY
jgi:hypothetical protein